VIFFSFAHIASTKSSVERGIDVARESKPGKKRDQDDMPKRSETCQKQTPGRYNLEVGSYLQ
jgi:hypothetical protein